MSEENLKACPIAYAKHKALGMVFERNYSSYGDINDKGDKGILMRKDRFIEVVFELMNTRQSPESKKIEEAIESINHLAEAVDNYELDDEEFSDNLILYLARIKNELKSILEGGES